MIKFSKKFFTTSASTIKYVLQLLLYSSTAERHLLIEKLPNNVVVFSLNREKQRNALSRLLLQQLEEACHEHMEANVVILKSQAPGMFCAGADLKERKEMNELEVRQTLRKLKSSFLLFEQLLCPTIAVIDGAALGGGLELALCADIRIATKQAQIGLPETGLAIIPGAGGTQRLPRLIGSSKAKELIFILFIFTGDKLNGEEALRMGIVNHSADNFELAYQKALEIAGKISEKGPVAIKAAKQAINNGMNVDLRSGLELEEACYAKTIPTQDRVEGLKAFAEKRKPVYLGK